MRMREPFFRCLPTLATISVSMMFACAFGRLCVSAKEAAKSFSVTVSTFFTAAISLSLHCIGHPSDTLTLIGVRARDSGNLLKNGPFCGVGQSEAEEVALVPSRAAE